MSISRHPLRLATVLLCILPAAAGVAPACSSDSASEGEEACHLQLPRSQDGAATAERAPVVILDRELRQHWGYTSSWSSGETSEWVYSDPCNKTDKLSWHAHLPYVNGITLTCLSGCQDHFKPKDKGGFRYINFKIYVPPGNHGTCSGDLFGQELSDGLMMELFGEEKFYQSMPSPMNRKNQITKSAGGMYWLCMDIPHMQQDPTHGEWAQISVQNWPMDAGGHQGAFEIYLDYVSLADTCFSG